MCSPSKELKAVNSSIQKFATQVKDEAGTVFGAANQVFNNIVNSVQKIVNGGPSQMGYSQTELNALNANAVESGGTMARNLKGAAASASAAVGGGNTVTPAGGTQASVQNAEIAAAEHTASAENQILASGFETGRKNYEFAVGAEQKAPDAFNASTNANSVVVSAQDNAMKSQQAIDTANNWWANDIMQLGSAAIGGFTSGLTGGLGGGGGLGKMFSKVGGSVGKVFSKAPSTPSTSSPSGSDPQVSS